MRYLKLEDFEIFDQEKELNEKMRDAESRWLDEARKAKNLAEYDATKPLFDEYLEVHKKWLNFLNEHLPILQAKKIDDR